MFVCRRGTLFALALSLVLLLSCSFALSAASAAAVPANAPCIVLDAGHGGIDAGVRGKKSGIKESDINLAITYELKSCFESAGFCVVLTRKSQAGLYGLPTKGFKLRDMQKRRDIIQECGADMVISVHQNFYSDGTRRGATVFFDKDSESGKQLAVCIQNSMNSMENAATSHSPLVGDYYMLKCTESPSAIVECGFLSNADDEALLCDSEYRKSVAYAIFAGAVSYYS